ncbi:MAG: hypothetical protein JST19_03815 [Bacteroidetes bacterium]|nr:hypothetical protein [Bacteroidota bacterium]
MKKIGLTVVIAALAATITACHSGRHTIIVETGNNHRLRIESYGKVYFSPARTEVAYISRGGYLEYQNDGIKLKAENNGHGGITYELLEHGEKLDPYTNGKSLIAGAVKEMIAKGYKGD